MPLVRKTNTSHWLHNPPIKKLLYITKKLDSDSNKFSQTSIFNESFDLEKLMKSNLSRDYLLILDFHSING